MQIRSLLKLEVTNWLKYKSLYTLFCIYNYVIIINIYSD